ncbi:hypothetical protein [Sphingobacterium humi]|uniref:Uncharacterized protein n=1 Tax=Sphingobacterium humi TaxID=1796905 RepID=A0A6N8L1W3_9SPHI|nr:hypothetical protein [Sphingobacterium humi]MVZ63713.1 hypothetical protein [Sphingobacterium humi]
MLNNQLLDNERVLAGLRSLNQRYSYYLEDEGKWLDGGFEILVAPDNQAEDPQFAPLHVKKEIFMMLPVEIREEIQKLIEVE